jgi:hypothetical protein
MTDAEKLRRAVEEDTFVGNLADLGPILVAEIKRLRRKAVRWREAYELEELRRGVAEVALRQARDERDAVRKEAASQPEQRQKTAQCCRCGLIIQFAGSPLIERLVPDPESGWICSGCRKFEPIA